MNKKGFLNFYVIGIMVVVVTLSSLTYSFLKKNSSTEIPDGTISVEKNEELPVSKTEKTQEINKPLQDTAPTIKDTSGYTFTIIGLVRDVTDAPAMTPGTPMASIVIRATGPKIVTTQTQSNGSYKLSFTNVPVGTYNVCVSIPSQYGTNPPSGCEVVIVRLSEKYDKTLELTVNGNVALHGTAINFNLMREQTR